MANDVIFNKGQGGLGRPLAGTDYISGMLFYSASLPTGFTSSDRIKIVYSVADAVALGITNLSVGETKSTATYLVTNKGAVGDTHALTCAIIDSVNPTPAKSALGTVTLASYTQVTADVVSTSTAASKYITIMSNSGISCMRPNGATVWIFSNSSIKIVIFAVGSILPYPRDTGKQMASNSLEYILRLKDLFSKSLENAFKKTKSLDNEMNSLQKTMGSIKNTIIGTFSIGAVVSFGKAVIESLKNYEYFHASLKTLLKGNENAAKALETQLINLAKTTPFQLTEVQDATKQLMAYGFKAGDVVETMRISALFLAISSASISFL